MLEHLSVFDSLLWPSKSTLCGNTAFFVYTVIMDIGMVFTFCLL